MGELHTESTIATKPRPALVAAKRALVEGMRLPLDEGLRLEGRIFMELQQSDSKLLSKCPTRNVAGAEKTKIDNIISSHQTRKKTDRNGQVVHENVEVKTPTGHAWKDKEIPVGPLLLQADHGPVAFRAIKVRPYTAGNLKR